MADPIVRVGIIGIGIAARQVLGSIDQTEGAQLTAVCDVREDEVRRWADRFDLQGFTKLEDMCSSGAVDAVWVATPNNYHAEHTIIAANHGKHVICEKPMAISLDEADRMVEAIERNNVLYVQGHSRIHRAYVKKMGEILASGQLGPIFQINTWMYNEWIQRPWEAHTLDPKRGGGVVFRQGPHQIDVVRYLAGGLGRSVRATVGRRKPGYDVEGDYSAYVDFEDGASALVSFNGYGYFDVCELTWGIGEGGRVHSEREMLGPRAIANGPIAAEEFYSLPQYSLEAFEDSERRQAERKQDFFGLLVVSCERGAIRQSPDGLYVYTEKGREEVVPTARELRAGEIQALVDAVRGGTQSFPDVRWGRATLEMCIAMIESSRERKEILLKHQVPSPIRPALAAIPSDNH
jgi:phthalate 4,5-cis-dihydrodiol dehydrogenase